MDIVKELQDLDDLIVSKTQPPVTAQLRNKLHPLREQMEAYVEKTKAEARTAAETAAENAKLREENSYLRKELEEAKRPKSGSVRVVRC